MLGVSRKQGTMDGVRKNVIPQGRPKPGNVILMESGEPEQCESPVNESEDRESEMQRTQRQETKRLRRNTDRRERMEPYARTVRPVSSISYSDCDALVRQIDEFRRKAEQLQEIVDEKVKEAQQLQEQVDLRQEQLDGFSAQISGQMNQLFDEFDEEIHSVSQDMEDGLARMESSLIAGVHKEIAESGQNTEELVQGLESRMGRLANQKSVKRISGMMIVTLILSILNTAGIVFTVLVLTGILRF